jgi:hypothetical protein
MASAIYPKALDLLGEGDLDVLVDTLKAVLVDTGTYTYSSAHDFFDDITGEYGTAVTLSSVTWVNGLLDAANLTFTSVPGTVSYEAVVIYKDTGGADSTDPLFLYLDGFAAITSNGGNITVTFDASGIVQL